jgi:dimethylaniline monooxygenase (N-oxide forming)
MNACIVGAGPCGLVTAKHLLEEGIECDLFEKRDDIGGLWYIGDDAPSLALSTTATSSKTFLQFSDFPMGKQVTDFPHSSEYIEYLRRYISKHDLQRRIHLRHAVVNIRKSGRGWNVTTRNSDGESQADYDMVAICSGLHHVPLIPDIPGAQSYTGEVIHSSSLKDPAVLANKRVIIVGAGESAADYAHDISAVAKEAYLSLRRGVAITRHFGLKGLPADYDATRAKAWMPRQYMHDYDIDCRIDDRYSAFKTLYTLMALPVLTAMLPVAPDRAKLLLRGLWHREAWQALLQPAKRHGPASGIELSRACAELCEGSGQSDADIDALAWKLKFVFDWYSGAMHNSQPFTKQNAFLRDIALKRLRVVPNVARFCGGSTIELEDGSRVEADTVILCTGFRSYLPFLQNHELDGRELYKNVFAPDDSTLGFIGIARPNIGSLPAIGEMQARWFAAVQAGRVALPSRESMREEIAADSQKYTQARPHHVKRATSLVDYHAYMHELAGYVGCRPDFSQLIHDPKLLFMFLFGPFANFQYRLSGHGANPEAVREAVAQLPEVPLERVFLHGSLYCVMKPWFVLLDKLGFHEFRPLC